MVKNDPDQDRGVENTNFDGYRHRWHRHCLHELQALVGSRGIVLETAGVLCRTLVRTSSIRLCGNRWHSCMVDQRALARRTLNCGMGRAGWRKVRLSFNCMDLVVLIQHVELWAFEGPSLDRYRHGIFL